MANWTYDIVSPTPISNAIVEKGYADGVHKLYRIEAVDGYGLHDKDCDMEADGITQLEPIIFFGVGSMTVRADYDFDNVVNGTYNGINGVIQVQKVGAKELYAIPLTEIPADNLYGGGNDTVVASVDDQTEQAQKE